MAQLCRDCLHWSEDARSGRCPDCGSPRVLVHAELGSLAIAHMDCDAFYASVEKRDDPALRDRPVIVGGGRRGVVSTCCYIARINGVRSAMPMFKALKLCPDAVVVKPRMAVYAEVSARIREMMRELTPLVEPLSLDEAFLDLTGTERLLGMSPAAAMAGLVRRIGREIGVTASVGLSHCKYLAKIASDLDKPRGFSVIGRAETLDFLAPRPVSTIWGVGRAMSAKLERDGYHTLADLRRADPAALVARYGAMGMRLSELSHGRDTRRVSPDSPMKSVSAETTFDEDTSERDRLAGHLWRLAVKVSDRAKAREIAGRTVTLKLKTAKFRTVTRQTGLDSAVNLADTLYGAAEPLLDAVLGEGPFRLIGIGISALEPAAASAPEGNLFDRNAATRARAESATDSIRHRFGETAIIRGRALK